MCNNIKENEFNIDKLSAGEAMRKTIDQLLSLTEKDYESLKKFEEFIKSAESMCSENPELKEKTQRVRELVKHEVKIYKDSLISLSLLKPFFTRGQNEWFDNISARPIPELEE